MRRMRRACRMRRIAPDAPDLGLRPVKLLEPEKPPWPTSKTLGPPASSDAPAPGPAWARALASGAPSSLGLAKLSKPAEPPFPPGGGKPVCVAKPPFSPGSAWPPWAARLPGPDEAAEPAERARARLSKPAKSPLSASLPARPTDSPHTDSRSPDLVRCQAAPRGIPAARVAAVGRAPARPKLARPKLARPRPARPARARPARARRRPRTAHTSRAAPRRPGALPSRARPPGVPWRCPRRNPRCRSCVRCRCPAGPRRAV